MNNPLKSISYRRKYCKAAGQLVELLAEVEELKKANRELEFRNVNLELEAKHQKEIAENTRKAAIFIQRINCRLEARNSQLREENLKLRFGKNFIEHKEVIRNEARTQSNGCGA